MTTLVRRITRVFLLGPLVWIGGCELAKVAAPPAEDVLVAEAVLRVGADRQHILLHRSLAGKIIRGEPGATIAITPEEGAPVQFKEVELNRCFTGEETEWDLPDAQFEASCYASPPEADAFVRPGKTYELTIRTTDGRFATGRTTVPGGFEFVVPAIDLDPQSLTVTCRLPREPFDMVWTRAEGTWAYIAALRLENWGEDLRAEGVEVPDPLDLSGVSISAADTTIHFPGSIGLFQRFSLDQRLLIALQEGLPDDADATLVILAVDPNYANAIRGGRFNPSGTVRLPSVTGDAVGVFGSVVPLRIDSPVMSSGQPTVPCALAGAG